MGLAKIDGRPVAVGGEDFTVRGGTSWGGERRKGGQGGFVEDLAHEYRIPLVNLIDGAGGTVTSAKRRGYTVFPGIHGFERSVQLMGEVPVVSACSEPRRAGRGRAILSHWSVMGEEHEQVFAAGPRCRALARAEGDEGGARRAGGGLSTWAGTIDNAADTRPIASPHPPLSQLHAAARVGAARRGRYGRRFPGAARSAPLDRAARAPAAVQHAQAPRDDRRPRLDLRDPAHFGRAVITSLAA
jgi:hypothetical protein